MFYLFKSSKTMKAFYKVCNTPAKIGWWMWFRIQYTSEPTYIDYWQPPLLTLASMKGDCDDYALLARAGLKALGYSPILMGIGFTEPIGKGVDKVVWHLTCIYYNRKKMRYYSLCNFGYRNRAKTLNGVAENFFKTAVKWQIMDKNKDILEKWVKVQGEWKRITKL